MTAAFRRPAVTVAAAFMTSRTCSTAFLEPLSCRRYSMRKCALAADVLLPDAADAAPPKLEMVPLVIQRRVVLYDGVCHLCHTGVKWIIKADKDKKIRFCCVQSKAAEPYMKVCGVDREDVLRRFLFVEAPDSYHQGSAAALRVCSYLPRPFSALSALMVVPTPLRDAVYDYVAKRRYDWFGKKDDCLVLKEVELLERFVDWEELLERSKSQQL
ncbi:LOW QUALITY PROTEIN: uncharacterized protein LOC130993687 [Salvia miltiorrhiza]|uniref:LOW QUALITY PROTEIN: uncharacterized protein LOC130993687 n=1 Tax=Salvia miltiorrhiza TaxID=226208 RepID=UPI0025AD0418|nr:LOW QUALITY PROTEIN: uncharacterized protein LOC130993687 [Salvia miltiorrhiza]